MTADKRSLPPRTIYLVAALAVFLVLCLALTICLFGSPRPPHLSLPPVAAAEEAGQRGEEKLLALWDAPLGPFSLELTEEEMTSLLAFRLPGSPFLKPQVHFRDEKAYISGVVDMGVPLTVESMFAVRMEGERPRVFLERAAIGPMSLAPVLLNSVSSTVNEMIDESGTGIMPSRVRIGDGRIVIEGVKSPPAIP